MEKLHASEKPLDTVQADGLINEAANLMSSSAAEGLELSSYHLVTSTGDDDNLNESCNHWMSEVMSSENDGLNQVK